MAELKTVQLTDKENNPISPYTPGCSVYFHSTNSQGKDVYTNMENMIGSMDIGRISGAQETAIEEIDDKRQWGLDKITEEGESYQRDINTLSGAVQSLYEKVFPLNVNVTIAPNVNTMKYSYTYSITEYGQVVTGASVNVKQQKNSAAEQSIYSGSDGTKTLTTDITWGRDRYSITCVKGTNANSRTDTRYLLLYGSYGETMTAALLQNQSVMSREVRASVAFTPTVNTTTDKPYIWIAVPEYLTITKITSGGFDVTMNQYVNIAVGDINYRAYRSKNPLQQNTWKLVIT